jgi:hypothetical protein
LKNRKKINKEKFIKHFFRKWRETKINRKVEILFSESSYSELDEKDIIIIFYYLLFNYSLSWSNNYYLRVRNLEWSDFFYKINFIIFKK